MSTEHVVGPSAMRQARSWDAKASEARLFGRRERAGARDRRAARLTSETGQRATRDDVLGAHRSRASGSQLLFRLRERLLRFLQLSPEVLHAPFRSCHHLTRRSLGATLLDLGGLAPFGLRRG